MNVDFCYDSRKNDLDWRKLTREIFNETARFFLPVFFLPLKWSMNDIIWESNLSLEVISLFFPVPKYIISSRFSLHGFITTKLFLYFLLCNLFQYHSSYLIIKFSVPYTHYNKLENNEFRFMCCNKSFIIFWIWYTIFLMLKRNGNENFMKSWINVLQNKIAIYVQLY